MENKRQQQQKTAMQTSLQSTLQSLNKHLIAQQISEAFSCAMTLAAQDSLPITELFTLCQKLTEASQSEQAIQLYRAWLEKTSSGAAYAVNFNLGVILSNTGDDAGAEQVYRQALKLNPRFMEAHLNLGTVLERRGKPTDALAIWKNASQIANPKIAAELDHYIQSVNNQGRLMEILKMYPEAEAMLTKSLLANPKQPKVITHLIHLRQKQCKWPIYQEIPGLSLKEMIAGTSALAMLSASDDPQVQLNAARTFVEEKVIPPTDPLAPATGYAHEKLRIGYLSSDLHSHAVSILTAELYELHDRTKVEVYAFSWTTEDGSPIRARVLKAMDHYIKIAAMTDEQAARCIRAHEIDILIDLHGLTSGTRPNILSYRPAPVQMTYLGFPGTSALPCIDYVIADKFVLPPELAPHFTERPLYMPHSFQINDRKREIGPRPTRSSCGLPEDAFVFCSFNNNFKITEDVFSCWMRILQRTPGSVLWLVSDHAVVQNNLRLHAAKMGIDPARLFFADRATPMAYLARYQIADLFLDTMPFNAGTTASDALWAGLPLLTCSGKSFSSRMAGSLLHAVNLPELICYNLADYEDKAVALAGQADKISAMKQQLAEHRLTCPLFDSPQFVRDLESLFEKICSRSEHSGTNSENIASSIKASTASTTHSQSAPATQQTQEVRQTQPVQGQYNADVLNFMRKDYRYVIEVGSENGALAQAYRTINSNCRYIGIENHAAFAENSKLHCSEVITQSIETLSANEFKNLAEAQCWVFPDTLETLNDPWSMLKNIRTNAKSGLEIIACITNAQYWGLQSCMNSGLFVYQESGLLARSHLRWFTRITILDLFNSNGFKVTEMISRNGQAPSAALASAIAQLAVAGGNDAEMALQDAIPLQYVVRAALV